LIRKADSLQSTSWAGRSPAPDGAAGKSCRTAAERQGTSDSAMTMCCRKAQFRGQPCEF